MQDLIKEELLSDLAGCSVDKAEQIKEIDIIHRLSIYLVESIPACYRCVLLDTLERESAGLWFTPAAPDLINNFLFSLPGRIDYCKD